MVSEQEEAKAAVESTRVKNTEVHPTYENAASILYSVGSCEDPSIADKMSKNMRQGLDTTCAY